MKKLLLSFSIIAATLALSGCSGVAKGVIEALLEHKEEDTRICEISGPAFTGIDASLAQENKHTKVLMVHGIGKHLPEYSARFREKLLRELQLDSREPEVRQIELTDSAENGLPAGILKAWKYFSSVTGKELTFYELTWSGIVEKEKEVIAFDDSEAYTYRRAGINKTMKSFMNATVPDVLVYEGPKQELIDKAVGQSVCWMFKGDWEDLAADGGQHFCDYHDPKITQNILKDDYFVVTHSLGSRIAVDTFNRFAVTREACTNCEGLKKADGAMQNETVTIFMLANQLPFLQVGRLQPPHTREIENYCTPTGALYSKRLIGKTRIIAFSDPNDILSYPVPPDYADNYIDSRICPEIVNVDINVAPTANIMGAASFANPLDAHSGYQEDDRVIKIISKGLNRKQMDPLIAEKCSWIEMKTKTEN